MRFKYIGDNIFWLAVDLIMWGAKKNSSTFIYLFKIFFFQKAVNLFKKTVMEGMMTWQPPSCIFVGQRKTPTQSLF